MCPVTRAYRPWEGDSRARYQPPPGGKNPREIRRCLKRYIARQLYRTLATAMTPATEAS